jgi:hypothetical protein
MNVSTPYPPGDLRVSDADRDRVLAELSEHFQAGRLTAEELDERSGRALQARTGRDLAVLLTDLPPGQARVTSAPPAAPAGVCPGPARRMAGLPIAVLAAIAAVVIAVAASDSHGHHGLAALLPVLIVALIVRRLVGGRPRGPGRRGL